MELFVKTVAYRNAPEGIIEKGRSEIKEMFPGINFRFISDKPDVIYFLSGGSEQEAIKSLLPNKHYLLLAGFNNNAYASATEVKAWAEGKGIDTTLVSVREAAESSIVTDFAKICNAYLMLRDKQAGLIGNVSHWLVASAFPLSLAKERFGINIKHLQWEKLPDYLSFPPDPDFLRTYNGIISTGLEKEARVYSFLQSLINANQLNGLTLECFDMVNDRDVTACLALAILNSKGIVAGCEGDLVSLTGMMLVQALTGIIPWMANVAGINNQNVLVAHCTAPLNLLNEVQIKTHFETDKSAAIQASLNMNEITVFRLSQDLDKAFISEGTIVSKPQHEFACRTQAEISLPGKDLEKLRQHPLGNHHLIIPGKQKNLLEWACKYKKIALV